MKEYLPILQIVISLLLIIVILLQQKGEGLGSAFGGTSGFYATQRGIQKKIFFATIVLAVLFILISLFNLII